MIIIIYDTISGNNEEMAKNISEGAQSEGSKVLVYKTGTKFPISILKDADAIVVGSPSLYGNMTPELNQFLDNLYDLNKTGKIKVTDKKGAVFGSYAWDGGWHTESIERRLRNRIKNDCSSAFNK